MGFSDRLLVRVLELAEGANNPVGTTNASARAQWLERVLQSIPAGQRILDAGAGEQPWRKFCKHLTYVAQDFGKYDGAGDGRGLQTGGWNQSNLDVVSDIASIPEPDACPA